MSLIAVSLTIILLNPDVIVDCSKSLASVNATNNHISPDS
jgi:hypothetical protein